MLRAIADQSGIESKRKHICARSQDRLTLISITDIEVFRADQKYVAVQHSDGETLIDESLKALEKEFGDAFVRIHRSALVAVAKIETIEKTADGKSRVILRGRSHDDDNELIISRRHVAEVRRRLKGG
jgi:two-component system response regulator AlgR